MADEDSVDGARWERLFADLGAEWEAAERHDLAAEVADRARRDFAQIRLVDRLRPAVGGRLEFGLVDAATVDGGLESVGPDWVLLRTGPPPRQVLIPLGSVLTVAGVGPDAAQPGSEGAVAAGLGLRSVLRRLARDRATLRVTLRGGRVLHGTCDRVGHDFLEFAQHGPGEPRRADAVHAVRLVPFSALSWLQIG